MSWVNAAEPRPTHQVHQCIHCGDGGDPLREKVISLVDFRKKVRVAFKQRGENSRSELQEGIREGRLLGGRHFRREKP